LPHLAKIAVMINYRRSLLMMYKIPIRGEKETATVAKGVIEKIKKQIGTKLLSSKSLLMKAPTE